MLTHPEAAEAARTVLAGQIERLGDSIGGHDDARRRATLMTMVVFGVTVGRQLLEMEELRDVPTEEIARLLAQLSAPWPTQPARDGSPLRRQDAPSLRPRAH
ncbi:hypothetical protein AB0L25_32035 [Spirillospora sp. NPDC052242]